MCGQTCTWKFRQTTCLRGQTFIWKFPQTISYKHTSGEGGRHSPGNFDKQHVIGGKHLIGNSYEQFHTNIPLGARGQGGLSDPFLPSGASQKCRGAERWPKREKRSKQVMSLSLFFHHFPIWIPKFFARPIDGLIKHTSFIVKKLEEANVQAHCKSWSFGCAWTFAFSSFLTITIVCFIKPSNGRAKNFGIQMGKMMKNKYRKIKRGVRT